LSVLTAASEYVKDKTLLSILTLDTALTQGWIESAKEFCSSAAYLTEEAYYGGPRYIDSDTSSFWSEPQHFHNWWKNSVERRSKFKVMQEDSLYNGMGVRMGQRARFCISVMNLSERIRLYCGYTAPRSFYPTEAPGAEDEERARPPALHPSMLPYLPQHHVMMTNDMPFPGLKEAEKPTQQQQQGQAMLLPTPKNAGSLSVLSYRNYANTFPAKLYDLVSNEGEGVVGWHAYGTSFQVRDMERFVSEVLPKHFKRKKIYSNFFD
jgi:hypothetical protein